MLRLITILAIAFLSGCSTFKIPSYTSDGENLETLSHGNKPISVERIAPAFADKGKLPCRAAGTVSLGSGKEFSEYIVDAIKNDLQSKSLYLSSSESQLQVKVMKVDFSSQMGGATWFIDTKYTIGQESFPISTAFNDRSSFVAQVACTNMAKYFTRAVDAHLTQLYAHPIFRASIAYSDSQPTDNHSKFRELKALYDQNLITEDEYRVKKAELLEGI